jgi:UDP-glucose 4-epimerase
MRVVVVGATGNVGVRVVEALARREEVEQIVGVARRRPELQMPKTRFEAADIRHADLAALFRGADAVVHLAWMIQPGRDERVTASTNVEGSRRVVQAVVEAGVPALVYASSVGAYAPGPKTRRVDEDWPATGIASSFYSRHKAIVERDLRWRAAIHPGLRIVVLRPGLIFQRGAASEIQRLFLGPLFPHAAANPRLIGILPLPRGFAVQAVHAEDVAEAYALAVTRSDMRGRRGDLRRPPAAHRARLGRPRAADAAHGDRSHPGARLAPAPQCDRRAARAARRPPRPRRRAHAPAAPRGPPAARRLVVH